MARLTVILCIAAFFASCAKTQLGSFVDPDFAGTPPRKSLIVFAEGLDLAERQIAEDAMVAAFGKVGVAAVRGVDILPPTRSISEGERAELIAATGIGAVLVLTLSEYTVERVYMPPTMSPGSTTTRVNVSEGRTVVKTTTSPGEIRGGYTARRPRAKFSAALHDVATGRTIWLADAKSTGDPFSGSRDLTKSAIEKTVAQLREDGLI